MRIIVAGGACCSVHIQRGGREFCPCVESSWETLDDCAHLCHVCKPAQPRRVRCRWFPAEPGSTCEGSLCACGTGAVCMPVCTLAPAHCIHLVNVEVIMPAWRVASAQRRVVLVVVRPRTTFSASVYCHGDCRWPFRVAASTVSQRDAPCEKRLPRSTFL